MTDQKFNILLAKYLTQRLTDLELDSFLQALNDPEKQDLVRDGIDSLWEKDYQGMDNQAVKSLDLFTRRLSGNAETGIIVARRKTEYRWRAGKYWLMAAALLVLAIFAAFLIEQPKGNVNVARDDWHPPEDMPGINRSYLTLPTGNMVVLDSGANRLLHRYGFRIDFGQHIPRLVCLPLKENEEKQTMYNTINTSKGGQLELELSDGSIVMLHPLSSLHFPISFSKETRSIDFYGEGYFQIRHDHKLPFEVKTGNISILVLGTRFTLSNYRSEPLRATLLQGQVKVSDSAKRYTLKPGQEISIAKGRPWQLNSHIDTTYITTWNDGMFDFRKTDLSSMMSQLQRWYDIQVVYKGDTPRKTFTGKIPHSGNVNDLVGVLKKSGIEIIREGNKIVFFR